MGLTGCAQNPVTGKSDFVMLSEDSEIAMGRANHPKIIEQYGRYDNEEVQQYVQSVGEKLASVSHRKNLVYRFTVLDSPVINAFALPGGYVYITRGLMAYLGSEAELAAVLGHEIGHVTARHGVRQQSAAQAANLGYTIGAILLPGLRGSGAQNIFNILGGALLSGYGREHELEADGLGAEYIARAGYDPKAMIEVIRVLKDQEEFAAEQAKRQGREAQGYHGLFASHPDNDTRLQGVVAAAQKYANGERRVINKKTYLMKINGLTFGDSEQQGIRSGRNFYHLAMDFAISFPNGWQINNNPTSLQAISVGGKAFIEVGVDDVNRKLSPEEFIRQRLKVTNLKSGRTLNVDNLKGYTGLFASKDGRPVRVSVIYKGTQAFIFFATTKEAKEFNHFDKDFIDTAVSFHRLRKNEKRLAKAEKIEIVTVTKKDSYAKWALTSRITNSPESQLRLLNGDYPQGKLEPGTQAKRVK